jgi:glycosyltransferase involved in cell wall biosynthesis
VSAPRVSIVIPSYNNQTYIAETVESILAQTFTDFELIISDHSSTDGTWSVLERFTDDPRVTLHTVPTGGGAERNWNSVTERATGEYVKLVCGDDLLDPHIVERQVAALDANPGAGLSATRRHIVDAKGAIILADRGLDGLDGLVPGVTALRATLRSGTNIFGEPACVMFRRPLLQSRGWIATEPYLIDVASYAAVLASSDLVALAEPLAAFRVNDAQWSVRLAREQSAQVRAFNRSLRREHPTWFSAADVALGNAKATALAAARRVAYIVLARRMNRG